MLPVTAPLTILIEMYILNGVSSNSFTFLFLGTAVRGGLTFREGNYICEALAETNRMTSMELVEVNPSLHTDINPTKTIEMGLALIGSTMGQTIL